MKIKLIPVVVAALVMMPSAVSAQKSIYRRDGWIDFNKNGLKDVYEDPSASIQARIDDLLSQMTMDEKTCQLATLYGSGRVLEDSVPFLAGKPRYGRTA